MKESKLSNEGRLPLVVSPESDRSVAGLIEWIEQNRDSLNNKLIASGAILFRGFDINSAQDFEDAALALDSDLKNDYLGTSPRDAVTKYVFSASELPGHYPIPQHCEMTFLKEPPRRLFFSCLIEPELGGGETPLCDFRAVYRDLDPAVRKRFENGGVRIVRNYTGPKDQRKFDPFQLKRWHEMFQSTDKTVVEQKCAEQDFETEWLDDDRLRITSVQPATRKHPITNEPVWYNHVQVFHLSAAVGEFKQLSKFRPTLRSFGLIQLSRLLTFLKRRKADDELPMQCTYEDGSPIPAADINHLRDTIWKNMVIFPWQKGDIVAIDNYSTAHGRLPYTGARQVVVAWA